MAETSLLGFTPAGTPLRYAPAPAPAPSPKAPSTVDDWESMSLLTALVILYVTILAPDPNLLGSNIISSPVELLPNNPIPENAITSHLGRNMWMGPGVRFYVS